MRRFSFVLASIPLIIGMAAADAQAQSSYGGPSRSPGFYVEGNVGFNSLNDIDFDIENTAADTTFSHDVGLFGAAALGYSLPLGAFDVRVEGELGIRNNGVDDIDFASGLDGNGDDDSAITAISGMINGHLDYYITQKLAVSTGLGIGYANVELDVDAEVNGVDLAVFNNEDDSAFAYQGRLGLRYGLYDLLTVNVAYTYFAVDEITVTDVTNVDSDMEYESHTLHIGAAYLF